LIDAAEFIVLFFCIVEVNSLVAIIDVDAMMKKATELMMYERRATRTQVLVCLPSAVCGLPAAGCRPIGVYGSFARRPSPKYHHNNAQYTTLTCHCSGTSIANSDASRSTLPNNHGGSSNKDGHRQQ
jgi:hypothetical protein